MCLQSWHGQGRLSSRPPTRERIRNLLALADRDLHKSHTPQLGPDWSLAIAYNAALQCATAALAACGYRIRAARWRRLALAQTM